MDETRTAHATSTPQGDRPHLAAELQLRGKLDEFRPRLIQWAREVEKPLGEVGDLRSAYVHLRHLLNVTTAAALFEEVVLYVEYQGARRSLHVPVAARIRGHLKEIQKLASSDEALALALAQLYSGYVARIAKIAQAQRGTRPAGKAKAAGGPAPGGPPQGGGQPRAKGDRPPGQGGGQGGHGGQGGQGGPGGQGGQGGQGKGRGRRGDRPEGKRGPRRDDAPGGGAPGGAPDGATSAEAGPGGEGAGEAAGAPAHLDPKSGGAAPDVGPSADTSASPAPSDTRDAATAREQAGGEPSGDKKEE